MKERYKKFCNTQKDLPVFLQHWWLDAVAGPENWDAVVCERGNEIVGCWPYCLETKLVFRNIVMPKLTQHMGIWLKYPKDQKYTKRLAFEKEIISELIDSFPKFDWFRQNFHNSFTNWLPFFWRGYKQTTKYTYRIEDTTSMEVVFSNYRDKTRNEIRKAEKHLRIEELHDIDMFYNMILKTFKRQDREIPYDRNFIHRLDKACEQNESRKMLMAIDENNKMHSAAYFIWDNTSIYYLMGGSDPELRNSGAASLIMHEGIKLASLQNKAFDFEGSMIESVERFFRSFGAKLTPYSFIEKINSRIIKTKRYFFN